MNFQKKWPMRKRFLSQVALSFHFLANRIAAHRAHDHAQLLQFPEHALAVADTYQDEIRL